MNPAQRIKKVRQELGFTQAVLGDMWGVEGVSIRRNCMGPDAKQRRNPSRSIMRQLEQAEYFLALGWRPRKVGDRWEWHPVEE